MESAGEQQQNWTAVLGRIGRLAQGLIFISVGLLSALAAFLGHPRASDSRGALQTIVQQPFGKGILLALIVGLVCYVLWRVLAGLIDLEQKGSDAKGLFLRARSLFIAAIYSGITAAAIKTLLGTGGGSRGDESARDWTAKALASPFGSMVVVVIGVAVVAGGLYQCFRAYHGRFEKQLRLEGLSAAAQTWVTRTCAFGIAARGVVFTIVGSGSGASRVAIECRESTRLRRRAQLTPRPAVRPLAVRDCCRRSRRLRRLLLRPRALRKVRLVLNAVHATLAAET